MTFEDAAGGAGTAQSVGPRTGTLRVVSIDGVDRSACGGTHVRSTAEIGAVLVRSSEKVRKTTRVEFVCGRRALRRARRDFERLSAIAASLSSSLDDAPAVVATQSERLTEARQRAEEAREGAERLSRPRALRRDDAGRGRRADDRRPRRDVDRRAARVRAGGVRAAARRGRRRAARRRRRCCSRRPRIRASTPAAC